MEGRLDPSYAADLLAFVQEWEFHFDEQLEEAAYPNPEERRAAIVRALEECAG